MKLKKYEFSDAEIADMGKALMYITTGPGRKRVSNDIFIAAARAHAVILIEIRKKEFPLSKQ